MPGNNFCEPGFTELLLFLFVVSGELPGFRKQPVSRATAPLKQEQGRNPFR